MPTIRDHIMSLLCSSGVQEAAAVRITLKSGEIVTIHSDDHPVLSRPASDVKEVKTQQTAQAGL